MDLPLQFLNLPFKLTLTIVKPTIEGAMKL